LQHARDDDILLIKVTFDGVMTLFVHGILTQKLNIGYNFAISQDLFMKLSNYIAYDNTLVMMPNSLGQGHI
jgi:hypothetical protein